MKKIRLGIVGTGGMARHHAKIFKRDCEGVELTACLDTIPGRAEEFAKAQGFKHAVSKLEDLLHEVDAVSVVTPDKFHASISLKVLEAGKHLLCEKPLTVTLDEAREVAAAARKASQNKQIHMIQFSYRKSAAFQEAMKVVKSGVLGELRHVNSSYLQSWLSGDGWGHWSSDAFLWRLETAKGSGGVLGDLGCHILDMTTGVAGSVKEFRCELATFPKLTPDGKSVEEFQGHVLDANDTAVMQMRFDHGALGICQTSRWTTGHMNHLRLEVHGTEGALMFDLDKDYDELNLCLGRHKHKAEWTVQKLKSTPAPIERFVHSIRTGKQDQPCILRGAEVQAYLDACERSAKSGHWEKVQAL